MSLFGHVQAKPGKRVGHTVDTSFPSNLGEGGVMMMMIHANIQLRSLIHRQNCTAGRSFPKDKKIQSRESKTACFVVCSFHCLKRNKDKPCKCLFLGGLKVRH